MKKEEIGQGLSSSARAEFEAADRAMRRLFLALGLAMIAVLVVVPTVLAYLGAGVQP